MCLLEVDTLDFIGLSIKGEEIILLPLRNEGIF